MKKHILSSILILAAFSNSEAQTYSDNFDSYTQGTFITTNSSSWSTWGNTPGSSEDTKIDTVKANSGSNSLHFKSNAPNGGPQDALLKFGGVYNLGEFNFESSIFVEAGKGGYINFQNSETPGGVWQMNANFINTGTVIIFGPGFSVEAPYPSGEWFDLRLEGNLSTAHWEVFINNVSVATYAATEENIASLNIYPSNSTDIGGNNQSSFWLDDMSFNYTPDTLDSGVNGGLMAFDISTVIVGQTKSPSVNFRNLGLTDISSTKIKFEYNGNSFTETVNFSSNLASEEIASITPTNSFLMVSGINELKATILETNGAADIDASDNVTTLQLEAITPAAGKLVIAEEGTGTWCGWCPRGAVAMEKAALEYDGFFQGIAVHNGDPMKDDNYDSGLGNLISGYPSALIDRGTATDPGNIPTSFIEQIQIAPKATLVNGAEYNPTTNELKVSLTVDLTESINSNWKIACAIVENNVTGTGSGYSQANYYAPGTNGVMGGYENLPSPVPAADMVYNEVARSISPNFLGYKGFADANSSGDTKTFNFVFTLEDDWKSEDMHIVGLFINSNKKIDNGSTSTIADAIAEGYVSGTQVLGTKDLSFQPNDIQIYPNPTSTLLHIKVSETITEYVHYSLTNVIGQEVVNGELNNNSNETIDVSKYTKGIYFLNFNTSNTSGVQKIIVD